MTENEGGNKEKFTGEVMCHLYVDEMVVVLRHILEAAGTLSTF